MPSNRARASLLDRLATVLTEHRVVVLSGLMIATIGLATQIPKIQVDPAPENLISSYEGMNADTDRLFRHSFGDSSRILVALVRSQNVLDRPSLQYQHDLAQHFQRHRWVEKVDGLTVIALPRRIEPQNANEPLNLEALESEEAATDDTHDGFEPAVYNALLDVTEADPERFPGGIDVLGPSLQNELRTDRVVRGNRVPDDAEAQFQAALRTAPLLVGRLISQDHKVAAVALYVRDIPARKMPLMVRALNAYVDAHPPPRGVEVRIAGLPYLRATMVEQMRRDQLILVPITVAVCALLLYLSMRWLPGVLLPLGSVAICAVQVVGGMALCNEPLNVLNNLIPPLLIIIGISEAIHIVERYREELARIGDRMEAGRTTVRTMAVACFLTTLTTAVGFAALLVSKTVMLRHFGLAAAIGVMLSYVTTMAFVPPILTWTKAPPPAEEKTRGHWIDAIIVRVTAAIIRKPWVALGITGAFLVGCFYAKNSLVVDHALLDQFNRTDPVYITTRLLENELDGIRPLEVMLTAPSGETFEHAEVLDKISRVEDWASRHNAVIRSTSYVDVMRQSLVLLANDQHVWRQPFANDTEVRALRTLLTQRDPNPLASWATRDGRTIRLQIKLRDVGAKATMTFVDELEHELSRDLSGTNVSWAFTGEAYNGSRGQQAVLQDLFGSLAAAVVMIFFQVSLIFRSARLGLLCIPPNLVPLAGTLAYMVLRGIPLNTATVIIFSISIGLADYGTIHVLSRFQEETKHGLGASAAILRSARGTGRAVIVANLTLMAGFGVLLLSKFRPVQHFGELIAVTVANCLIATVFMQPALLKLFGLSRAQKKRLRASSSEVSPAIEA